MAGYYIVIEGTSMATSNTPAGRIPPAWWPKERRAQLLAGREMVTAVMAAYPTREIPDPFVPLRNELMALARQGVHPQALIESAALYAAHCAREGIPERYRLGATRFYRDGVWHRFHEPRVYGMTREAWRKAGLDLSEFDRLSSGWDHYGARLPWDDLDLTGEAAPVAAPVAAEEGA